MPSHPQATRRRRAAPGTLAATPSGTQVALSWIAATDNVGVTGYRIERCQGVGCSSFAQIGTTSGATTYTNTGLASGASYSSPRPCDGRRDAPRAVSNSATPRRQRPSTRRRRAHRHADRDAERHADRLELDRRDRQRRRHRLPHRAVPGCWLQQLRPDRHDDRGHHVHQHRAGKRCQILVPRPRDGRRDAARTVLQHRQRIHRERAGGGPTGLLAGYSFNAGSGTTAVDGSGNGITGTLVGATWTAAGKMAMPFVQAAEDADVDLGNPTALQGTGSTTWPRGSSPRDSGYRRADHCQVEQLQWLAAQDQSRHGAAHVCRRSAVPADAVCNDTARGCGR